MSRHQELATFLRARRERLRPHEVGLPDGLRRRTPGLRRQEVAELAGVSIDYYIRLEQGRGSIPSRQVLDALARAFMLTGDERAYLYRLTGAAPPEVRARNKQVPGALQQLLDSVDAVPAYIVDASYDMLAWNPLAGILLDDPGSQSVRDRNVIRGLFAGSDGSERSAESGESTPPVCGHQEAAAQAFAHGCVADLRAAMARYPGDRGIADLVTEMLGTSPRFAAMWAQHDVEVRRSYRKQVHHPDAGPLDFTAQLLHVPDSDLRVIMYLAEPGSETAAAFRRLADLAPAPTHGALEY